MSEHIEKRLLNGQEVSEIYGLPVSRQQSMRRQRIIPYIQIGGRVLYDRLDLEAFISRAKVEALPEPPPVAPMGR